MSMITIRKRPEDVREIIALANWCLGRQTVSSLNGLCTLSESKTPTTSLL